MDLKSYADKLHDSIKIFTYSHAIKAKAVTGYLIVQKSWTQNNQEKIRSFFITLFGKPSDEPLTNRLKTAITQITQPGDNIVGILIDGSAIYICGEGESEVW